MGQQEVSHVQVTLLTGRMEGCVAICTALVHVRAAGQQQLGHRAVAALGRA